MAKKLSDIEEEIRTSSEGFHSYLQKIIPLEVLDFLSKIKAYTNIYLFSGVIRNYFIGKKYENLRDIDFLIEDEVDIEKLFPTTNITKNSFGGYKIIIVNLTIDLWVLKNTWGLNYGQLKIEYRQLEHLPNTTFFNFSSILFSLNRKEFIIGKPFLKFLRDKILDVVMEENPFPALCIVNSFYYSEKYKLKMSDKLVNFISNNYNTNIDKFEEVQLKHFGEILFSKNDIIERIKNLIRKIN